MFNLKEAAKSFSEGFKDLLKPGNPSDSHLIEEVAKREPVQEKEQQPLESGYEKWWTVKNAEYYRNSCRLYSPFIFQNPGDFDLALGKALAGFWHSCGAVTVRREFPEIHIMLLTVNVYRLRDTWNRRDIDLKQALLVELRRGFVEFAHTRGFSFEGWFDYVVTDVWKVKDTLIIELPCSPFVFTYPQLVPVLEVEEHRFLKRRLSEKSQL